jgi:hypothetical protein
VHRPTGRYGLSLARSRDRRAALRPAQCPHHAAPTFRGIPRSATDIMVHAKEILSLKKRLNEIYIRHTTGQALKKIENALERDYPDCGEGEGFRCRRYSNREAPHSTGRRGLRSRPERARRSIGGFRNTASHNGPTRGHGTWTLSPEERNVTKYRLMAADVLHNPIRSASIGVSFDRPSEERE